MGCDRPVREERQVRRRGGADGHGAARDGDDRRRHRGQRSEARGPQRRYDPRRGGGTMRRLLRWTFNTLAMASLLLCLATAGLWVRSYWVCDQFYAERQEAKYHFPHYDCVFVSYRGQLVGSFNW